MEAQVQQYGYLWDGTAPQWALMNVGASGSEPEYLIVNTDAKAAKLIENNLDADEVVKRMLAAGVRVLTPAEFQAN
ncbi:hypothetical protein [Delftia acidovorans]|uniref:hypothetical protein n=1 Tax=Delftia acidovorans TaxID=80866 RepID=UPI0012D339A2|nr:hypothetical protein [Delftia acidovorans]QQB51478.1 hypothetical protein I6H54_04155 [Delftia acidovorans]